MKKLSILFLTAFVFEISIAQWTTSGTNIYNSNTGNVGVGTATPQYALDVTGDVRGSHSFYCDQGTDNLGSVHFALRTRDHVFRFGWGLITNETGGNLGSDFSIWRYGDDGSYLSNTFFIKRSNGYVGIGNATPAYNLDVVGTNKANSFITDAGMPSYSGDYQFRSSGTYKGRFIWYSSAYSGLSSNSITVENPTGVHIADFFENGNTAFGGNVAIGTTNDHGYKLAVNGNVLAQKIRISQTGWPDYVFHPTYKLPSLKDLENYIKQNNHLPEVPSADEVKQNGLDVGDNQAVLLKKIEELTLYIIEQDKTIKEQDKKIESQQHQITDLMEIKKDLETIKAKLQAKN